CQAEVVMNPRMIPMGQRFAVLVRGLGEERLFEQGIAGEETLAGRTLLLGRDAFGPRSFAVVLSRRQARHGFVGVRGARKAQRAQHAQHDASTARSARPFRHQAHHFNSSSTGLPNCLLRRFARSRSFFNSTSMSLAYFCACSFASRASRSFRSAASRALRATMLCSSALRSAAVSSMFFWANSSAVSATLVLACASFFSAAFCPNSAALRCFSASCTSRRRR